MKKIPEFPDISDLAQHHQSTISQLRLNLLEWLYGKQYGIDIVANSCSQALADSIRELQIRTPISTHIVDPDNHEVPKGNTVLVAWVNTVYPVNSRKPEEFKVYLSGRRALDCLFKINKLQMELPWSMLEGVHHESWHMHITEVNQPDPTVKGPEYWSDPEEIEARIYSIRMLRRQRSSFLDMYRREQLIAGTMREIEKIKRNIKKSSKD